jgi:hypothetical protein
MKQSVPNVNLEADKLNVVIVSQTTKLKGQWLFLFQQSLRDLPEALSPIQRTVLLDILCLGFNSPMGLVCCNISALLYHGIGRTSVYRALSSLKELGLVAGPKDGIMYLNPQVAYRGHARDWGHAMVYWKYLGGKYEE